jgi:diguanylate cyclase (GGDEF)-like protein
MRLIVEFVRARAGDRGVRRLLQLAGEQRTERQVCDERGWSTYGQKIALFEAAAVVLDDPVVARHVGEASLALGVGASTKALLRSLGSPAMVLRNLPRITGKFTSVAVMEALEIERSRALIAYHVLPVVEPHRADCQYNIGLLSQIGPLFGLPRSSVVQYGCQAEGDRRCIYELSWVGKAPSQRGRRRKASVLAAQLADLDATFDQVLSTAADLVSDDDVDTVLARITNRAAVAAHAPQFVLAVRPTEYDPLRVHHVGLTDDEVALLVPLLTARLPPDDDPRLLVVDVASSRRRYGRLAARYPESYGFLDDERRMLSVYARHAAAALDAATALDEVRDQRRHLVELLDLSRSLASAREVPQVADQVAVAVTTVVGARRAAVFTGDAAATTFTLRATHGWAGGARRARPFRLRVIDNPEVAEVLRHGRPRRIDRETTGTRTRRLLRATGLQSALLAPIVTSDRTIGVLIAGWTGEEDRDGSQDPRLHEALAGVADQAGIALERAELLEQVRHQALHDSLTDLPNASLVRDRAERALASLSRHPGRRTGVLFIDLDRFKSVNDDYGHAAGDAVLREVAHRLAGSVRAGDTVGRLGGDEFVVLLPDLSGPGNAYAVAGKVLERLRVPIEVEGKPTMVTASVGVAVAPDDGMDYEALLARADASMYRAKESGRNTVRGTGAGSTP